MKIASLVLTALFAATWAIAPLSARANNDDDGDRVTVEKEVRRERGGGDRERGDNEGGMRGRRDGPGNDPEMKERLEKMRETEQKLHELHKKISQGPDSEKASAKPEARKLIGELFDAKLALETAMLAKLEKHAAELKEKIAKKKSNREKMIDSKLARIVGDGDDWE